MDKTAPTLHRRQFLIEGLPGPLTPAARHLQIFDNYIPDTRLRIRKVRDPETKNWTHIFQQLSSRSVISEMYLNDAEYAVFERFEGREIRKNRYFHEFDGHEMTFDVYLGGLWGLNMALVDLSDAEQAAEFIQPSFAVLDVTSDEFFTGASLVGKTLDDVRDAVARLERSTPIPRRAAQE